MNIANNANVYEDKHKETLLSLASECTLFLKRNNDDFPINKNELKEIGLYGSGARKTLKGGTGSGNVDIHVFYSVEDIFEKEGIKVTSKKYLDKYDEDWIIHKKEMINNIKAEAKRLKINPPAYSVGFVVPEWERDYSAFINNDEVVLYILSRSSGEGRDREDIKGQYSLTDSEIREIKFLSKTAKKFMLVINAAFPIDISSVIEDVDNILLLNYLGCVTSETLYKIVVGEAYPSGKLSWTYDIAKNYPSYNNFGDLHTTLYKEGIYVGYRYFSTYDKKPLFSFGFGLGYTKFEYEFIETKNDKYNIKTRAKVTNIGDFKGKEVLQLYLSKPSTSSLKNPRYELVGYAKSKELKPKESDTLNIDFNLADFASFDPSKDVYILPSGIYLLSLGNSVNNLTSVASIEIKEDIITKKVKHIDEYKDFKEDLSGEEFIYTKLKNNIVITSKDIPYEEVKYSLYKEPVNDLVNSLSEDELIKLSIGNIRGGLLGMIGDSCTSLLGGAGETCISIDNVPHLVMVDGPAGIRIAKECILCKNDKKYKISTDPIWEEISVYLPKIFNMMVDNKKNAKKRGEIYYQYTTSIPVASALSCSFNDELLYKCGEIIKKEMEVFDADIWLAPAMNILRDPRCGRNFEYYSEDPYISYRCAINIIKGVQNKSNKKVCIKHYTCNNQELNRTHNNSILSIRALREIYLRGFEKTVKYADPFSVMTSYNLVNGEHVSDSYLLVNDILRNEFNFNGLVITDWISTGDKADPRSINPSSYASKNIKAGTNISMPGKNTDIKDIKAALSSGYLTIDDLKNNCSIILNKIYDVKH